MKGESLLGLEGCKDREGDNDDRKEDFLKRPDIEELQLWSTHIRPIATEVKDALGDEERYA